jgi:hypothetical protein
VLVAISVDGSCVEPAGGAGWEGFVRRMEQELGRRGVRKGTSGGLGGQGSLWKTCADMES